MPHRLTRRHALRAAAVGYLYTGPAASVLRAAGSTARLRVAGIGVGGKGGSDIDQAGRLMEVAALCDIDAGRLAKKGAAWPAARRFADWRELLDAMGRGVDAVVVSTPDHSHAGPAVRAMRAGKHVYCQKPLARTPAEARLMARVAAETGVCTQMGNQGSALSGLRRAVELVRGGALGAVAEAHVWTNRPFKYWKQAPDVVARPPAAPVPTGVSWDLWLGPAAERPYAVRPGGRPAYHPHDWRGYWDFGTGALGDMACHTANLAFRALDLAAPTGVTAEAGPVNPETYPAWAHITYRFPARGKQPACALHWYEGERDGQRMLPPADVLAKALRDGEKPADSGCLLVGEAGLLYSPNDYGAKFRLLPEPAFAGTKLDRPEAGPLGVDKDNDPHMKAEWAEAIRAGKPAVASSYFGVAGPLTETMLLGNIAVRFAGQELAWDAAAQRFPDSPAATRLVRAEYRKGWELPGAG
jgi:predicted dehydrogenase